MSRRHVATLAAVFAVFALSHAATALAGCDEDDPAAPARTAQITLGAGDAADPRREILRTFIATDSLGRADVSLVGAKPSGIVKAISAVPELSRFSRDYGEAIKGIAVTVRLKRSLTDASVELRLRQVCAEYFRDTFLYY